MKGVWLWLLCSCSSLVVIVHGWSLSNQQHPWTRRNILTKPVATAAILVASTTMTSTIGGGNMMAQAATTSVDAKKQIGISNEALAKIILQDVQDNQFMVRADLTRSVYDEGATFTDEIDTYALDAWIQGTKRLFVAHQSHVDMVPHSLQVTDTEATFLFTEFLTFNIPLLKPKVYLSGKVILQRDPTTGLITSYQEKWDQDVNTVLLSAKFGGGK